MQGSKTDFSTKTVAVLGAGQMGSGIAHVCALAGMPTHLYDSQPTMLPQACRGIVNNLARQVNKEKITAAQAEAAKNNIHPQATLGDWLQQADFVIEAINEDRTAKSALYRQLTPYLSAKTIVASNTSSYSITELAAHVPQATQFIGMHFMNPVPIMPLVEIILGAHTLDATYQQTAALATALGKQTIRANDSPGFIANRILMPMLNEAIFALHENVGGVEDIDRAMTLGMNHPMGPLTLADFIGLDTCLAVLGVLYDGFQDAKFRPCPLLNKLVAAGHLGKKSGIGFYDYRGETPQPQPLFLPNRRTITDNQ